MDRPLPYGEPGSFPPLGMCRVRACDEEKEKKRTVDSKSFHRVFFGYDHAASAAILEKLPGMSILYSAHGRYNDEDFPSRSMESRSWDSVATYGDSQSNPAETR